MTTLTTSAVSAPAPATVWPSWLTRGGLAVGDQGLFAGANFVASILLARWMSADGFGAFSVAYSIFLLVAALHTAALSEPMLVFGAGKHAPRLERFLALTLACHLAASALVAGGLLLVSGVFYYRTRPELAGTFLALSIATPGMLMYGLVRRAFYIRLKPAWPAVGGVVYFALTIAGIAALHRAALLSAASALLVNGLAGVLVSVWLSAGLHLQWAAGDDTLTFRDVVTEYGKYARWSSPAMLVAWVPHNVFYVALPMFATVQAAGVLRALTNVITPVLNVMVASSSLLLPLLAMHFRAGGASRVRRTSEAAAIVLLTVSCAYAVIVLMAGEWAVDLVYAGRYRGSGRVLPLLALLPVCYAPILVYDDALRASGRMAELFYGYAASTFVALTIGLALAFSYGLVGAAWALLVSTAASGIALTAAYYRRFPRALAH